MSVAMVTDTSSNVSKALGSTLKGLDSEAATLEELYTKKRWHQLSLTLATVIKDERLQGGDQLIQLYDNFIAGVASKIKPIILVELVSHIVTKYNNPKDAVNFLKSIEETVKVNNEAVCLCKVLQGNIHLQKLNDLAATKTIIEEVEKILDDSDGITVAHSRFYLLASNYYRQLGAHADYYKTALRYLGCIELSELSTAEQAQHAFFLGLAGLLGEGVYNLGELLAHPVLESLKGTSNQWLIDLLQAFNSGDIAKFEEMKPKWSQISELAAHELKLRQKISLLCLMEMTFKRASNRRDLTFQEISTETRLPLNEVELLVMKALAQGLVRGAIDQVAGTVHMTWVQPRVLNKEQISSMAERLNSWCKEVSVMETVLESKGHEFMTM